MLIQTHKALPPPDFTPPPWAQLGQSWKEADMGSNALIEPTALIKSQTISLGHDDIEAQDSQAWDDGEIRSHEFGWDNESPARAVQVGAFRAEWRPVTNGEFEAYRRKSEGRVPMPKSWVEEEGEVKVSDLCMLDPSLPTYLPLTALTPSPRSAPCTAPSPSTSPGTGLY